MNRTRKKWLMFLAGWIFVSGLAAQEGPVPVAPYLARAPEFSAWKIQSKKAPASVASEGLRVVSRVVTKTGSIRREVCTLSDQTQKVVWVVGASCYKKFTPEGWTKLKASSGNGIRDFSTSDFPELDFVRLDTFKKVETKSGKLCFLYEANAADLASAAAAAAAEGMTSCSGAASSAKAWIDAKTQLPIAYQVGRDVWVYTFLPVRSEMLPLPPEIKILAEMDQESF